MDRIRINIYEHLLFLKGEIKTLSVDFIARNDNGSYAVKFKRSEKILNYKAKNVVLLSSPEILDLDKTYVYIDDNRVENVESVRVWTFSDRHYYLVTFARGYLKYCSDTNIKICKSAIAEKSNSNVFEYLKKIAECNSLLLGNQSLLGIIYDNIDYIHPESVGALYLDRKSSWRSNPISDVIFPFGANRSQEDAVRKALSNKLSIIQGPPGTGKTQTILNIISNLIVGGRSVLVVSGNNSGTDNVVEKLDKNGLGFFTAKLGNGENKDVFFKDGQNKHACSEDWKVEKEEFDKLHTQLGSLSERIKYVYECREKLAAVKEEIRCVSLEQKHFEHKAPDILLNISSDKLMDFRIEKEIKNECKDLSFIVRLKMQIASWIQKISLAIKYRKDVVKVLDGLSSNDISALFYERKLIELNLEKSRLEEMLESISASDLMCKLTDCSLKILRGSVFERFDDVSVPMFDRKSYKWSSNEFLRFYPIVTSTAFSARSNISDDTLFDYVIMDEASQVSIDSGFLAITCARNAVIVGDNMQLPNVVTEDDREKFEKIFKSYDISEGYNCAAYSFLESIIQILPQVPVTLLREHYRCAPPIINFCNKNFYGGSLTIMTQDTSDNAMTVYRLNDGNHARGKYNEREIDVITEEILPKLEGCDVGVIAPYNIQVDALKNKLTGVEVATVHKFQGREKDVIILSTVDNQIKEFVDNPNLLNVAVSRARKKFIIVVPFGDRIGVGNISNLVHYIDYNNFEVVDSNLKSIFDYLYKCRDAARERILNKYGRISIYDSENLTNILLKKILSKREYAHLSFKDQYLLKAEFNLIMQQTRIRC